MKRADNCLGYSVTMIVRKAASVNPANGLTVIEGSCLSEEDMQRAFKATTTPVDAVVVFLNAQRVGQKPWGKFIGPTGLIANSTKIATKVLRAQKHLSEEHKPRLVVMSALGVGDSYAVTPYIIRFVMKYTNVSKSYDDHNVVNNEIELNCGDGITWTLPLPVGLKESGQKTVKTFGNTESGAGLYITRESCARWMVDVAAGKMGDDFDNRRVILSN